MAKYISPIHKAVIPNDSIQNLGTINSGLNFNSSSLNLITPVLYQAGAYVANVTINYTSSEMMVVDLKQYELSATLNISNLASKFRFIKISINPRVVMKNEGANASTDVYIKLNFIVDGKTYSNRSDVIATLNPSQNGFMQNVLISEIRVVYDTRTNAISYEK